MTAFLYMCYTASVLRKKRECESLQAWTAEDEVMEPIKSKWSFKWTFCSLQLVHVYVRGYLDVTKSEKIKKT